MFNEEGEIRLLRERHAAYVSKGLKYLGPGFICLDARYVRGPCFGSEPMDGGRARTVGVVCERNLPGSGRRRGILTPFVPPYHMPAAPGSATGCSTAWICCRGCSPGPATRSCCGASSVRSIFVHGSRAALAITVRGLVQCKPTPPTPTATLESLQNPTGGFGGGYQQLSHCAPTYAAVLALMVVGTEDAYRAIDRSVRGEGGGCVFGWL